MSDRIPVGYAELHIHFRLDGDPETMISSIGLQLVSSPDFVALSSSIDLACANFSDYITNQYLIGPHVLEVGTVDGTFPLNTIGAAVAGVGLGDATPQNTAYLVRKTTVLGGRRNRGRMYIPGIPEGSINGVGVIDAATVVAFQASLVAFFTEILDSDQVLAFVLFHETAPFDPTQISDLQIQPQCATQRRRLRR